MSATEGGTPEASPEFVESVGELLKTDSNKDFGQTVINWIAFGKPSGVAFGDTSLLSTVSFTLNALALVMMAYLSMLGGLTYIIQTANKGTPGASCLVFLDAYSYCFGNNSFNSVSKRLLNHSIRCH